MMQAAPSPSRFPWRWLVLGLALCCSSCGSKFNPVQGKVTYQDKPAVGAVVTFNRQGEASGRDKEKAIPPVGVVKEDGTFTVSTGKKEGAPAGDYVLTITWPSEKPSRKEGLISPQPPEMPDRLKGAYASREKSKLKVQIKDGQNNELDPIVLKGSVTP